ncbi:MAG: hypothetical protein WCL21_05040 [Mariniphaga sp.]
MKDIERKIFLGNCEFNVENHPVAGDFMEIEGEPFYKISNYDQMDPFFLTIVSNSDHWMFISSNGALSAGRKNPDNALFPYYTVDKIQDAAGISGSNTLMLIKRGERTYLWEPFSDNYTGIYQIRRNLYKSIYGNKLVFEEINHDLGANFAYQWSNSEKFGFIKKSSLINNAESACKVSVLDGIQNILPAGINRQLQLSYSNLVDAYKKNERISNSSIALFMLSAVIVDRAEPSEALKTTIVWSHGLENTKILLSSNQVNNFRKGHIIENETDVRATRGAYFVNAEIELAAGQQKMWHIISEVNKDAGDIAALRHFVAQEKDITLQLQKDEESGTQDIVKFLASADGLQLTRDKLSVSRHLSNVFFNIMRGGIFDDNYTISKQDLLQFILGANNSVYHNHSTYLQKLDSVIYYPALIRSIESYGDTQLIRLCYEYFPLAFSRRHGDPSRPWNLFSIEMKREDGSKNLNYQGNWRDIFQNWEALGMSYPSFIEGMICKFLNASTVDGYNPFRITRNGVDWESPDPGDPWASIGYWGDHQVIYLVKFLELSRNFHPGKLDSMLSRNIFSYANVPYRIKSYPEIVGNSFDTIEFDNEAEKIVLERISQKGNDGKLIWDKNGDVLHVNFTEKILVSVLAKLSNFIPEAGIWMNTQRPEWNDANNALVGNGVSMVTLYYMRRLHTFCMDLFHKTTINQIKVSKEIGIFFHSINNAFLHFEPLLAKGFSDQERKLLTDALGMAGSNYRGKIYSHGFSGTIDSVDSNELATFFALTIKYIDHTIRKNRRSDNLYHAYNLISFKEDAIVIRPLYEMLEGQVAVLSSGILNTIEVNEVLDALKRSAMFRTDQYSYMLYPDRQLKRFTEKNSFPASLIKGSQLLTRHLAENNKSIVYKDLDGICHFNSNFRNALDVKQALELIQPNNWSQSDKNLVLEIFENVFDHQSFTGRSGAFYGFEGLGCIYWHMVSKLLLAISENYFSALKNNADKGQLERLIQHYYDVRAGLGQNKSPEVFGAFPTDAYSHTPGNGGAKQPGMTGQVKEDIITRFSELGIFVVEGKITFIPGLLRKSEFLERPEDFQFITLGNEPGCITLSVDSLAFTYCQVPFVYHISEQSQVKITHSAGIMEIDGLKLDTLISDEIFNRMDIIKKVDVYLMPGLE